MFYGAHYLRVSLRISWALPVVQSVYKYVIRALRYLTVFTKYEYLQSKGSDFSCTAWPLKMGPIICPETAVTTYHSTLRRISEDRRSQINFGENMRRCRNDYHKGQGRNLGNTQVNRKKETKFSVREKKTYIVKTRIKRQKKEKYTVFGWRCREL